MLLNLLNLYFDKKYYYVLLIFVKYYINKFIDGM